MGARLRRIVITLAAIVVAACSHTVEGSGASATDPTTGVGPTVAGGCAGRSGTYAIRWTERPGNDCGALVQQTFSPAACEQIFCLPFSNDHAIGKTIDVRSTYEGCNYGEIRVASDNCTVDFNFQCDQFDRLYAAKLSGAVTWDRESATAKGTMDVTYFRAISSEVPCLGFYDVELRRQ